jgi:hypothetical protein
MDQCTTASRDPKIGCGAGIGCVPIVQTEAGPFGCWKLANSIYYNPADGYIESEATVDHTSLAQYICASECVATTTTTTDPSAPSWTCNKKSNIGVCLDGLDDAETETEIADEKEQQRECQEWCYSKKTRE